MWLGYLEEYPDYMTQGETAGELRKGGFTGYARFVRLAGHS